MMVKHIHISEAPPHLKRMLEQFEESIEGNFLKFAVQELSAFQLIPTEVPLDTFCRLLEFVTEAVRLVKFLGYAPNCPSVLKVCKSKAWELFDAGHLDHAEIWIHLAYVFNLLPFVHSMRMKDAQSVKSRLVEELSVYKNRMIFTMEWILRRASHVNIDRAYISINLIYGGDIKQEMTICINPTIQLKTIIMLIESHLANSNSTEKKEVHLDSSQYSFTISDKFYGQTLLQLGLDDCSTVHVVPFITKNETTKSVKCKKQKHKKKRKHNNRKKKSKCNRGGRGSPGKVADYSTNEDEDKNSHRVLLDRVHEEAFELFRTRRQRLNDLAIKKSPPKQRRAVSKSIQIEPEPVHHCCFSDIGSKAGKSFFPVLVGHEEYLYKTSKITKHTQISSLSLDLHGHTKDDAIDVLNSSLPLLINAAMKEDTCKLPVNIICGSGNQVLSETVERWIRENRNVTNRFM